MSLNHLALWWRDFLVLHNGNLAWKYCKIPCFVRKKILLQNRSTRQTSEIVCTEPLEVWRDDIRDVYSPLTKRQQTALTSFDCQLPTAVNWTPKVGSAGSGSALRICCSWFLAFLIPQCRHITVAHFLQQHVHTDIKENQMLQNSRGTSPSTPWNFKTRNLQPLTKKLQPAEMQNAFNATRDEGTFRKPRRVPPSGPQTGSAPPDATRRSNSASDSQDPSGKFADPKVKGE